MKIRKWQTSTNSSTRQAQFGPNQTRVTGQKRAFLQRYQPQKTGAEVRAEKLQQASIDNQRVSAFERAALNLVGAGIRQYQNSVDAKQEAYAAETDAMIDEAKSIYQNEAAKISAEQKYTNIETTDEDGNFAFATDVIEQNYQNQTDELAEKILKDIGGRKDSARALTEFESFRNDLDLSHKAKLYNEGAAMSFKHAQERTKMNAMKANNEFELQRIMTRAKDNGLFSDAEAYDLKMRATERIHTNNFSASIDMLGSNLDKLTDDEYFAARDQLVSELFNDNDDLIITKQNRTDMVKKIQTLDDFREEVITQNQNDSYLRVRQIHAETGNDDVLRSALRNGASERFGHENTLKLISKLEKKQEATVNKEPYKNQMHKQISLYNRGKITAEELEAWAFENEENIGSITPVFSAIDKDYSQQQRLDIEAAESSLSYYYAGMRADEVDFSGALKNEQRQQWAKAQSDLNAYLASNPDGDVRAWALERIASSEIDPEVAAIEGVGPTFLETNWSSLVNDRTEKARALEREISQTPLEQMGSPDVKLKRDEVQKLTDEIIMLQRYQRTMVEIKKPENAEVLRRIQPEANDG